MYAFYMPIDNQNTFQLKEWFRCHKFMYFKFCETNIEANKKKDHLKGIFNRNPAQKTA